MLAIHSRSRPSGERHIQLCAAIALLLHLASHRAALAVTGPHGTVELIADQTWLKPGQPLWVGLHFQLEKGWHIYWTNPGDSGEAARVKWDLPAGFRAGSLLWPIPQRIEDHSLIDYGYLNEVLLPVEITSPATLGGSAEAQLSATVNWLVCREICIPGRATIGLTRPIRKGTAGPTSPLHSLFAQARANLPRPAPPFWKVRANLDKHRWVLNIDTGKPESNATFFPLDGNQIENAAPQKVSPSSRGIQIELQKSDQLLKAPPQLRGLLVLATGQGFMIDAPVTTTK